MKLIADAGLVGLPNAGKSTFLATVTAAKPKIADYPFTTLHPGLGVVRIDGREFVLADIPGLIEGAHEGAGLGDRFLGHVERCRVLLHLVDGTGAHAGRDYKTVRHELAAYGHGLADKPEIVALSKADALDEATLKEQAARLKRAAKKDAARAVVGLGPRGRRGPAGAAQGGRCQQDGRGPAGSGSGGVAPVTPSLTSSAASCSRSARPCSSTGRAASRTKAGSRRWRRTSPGCTGAAPMCWWSRPAPSPSAAPCSASLPAR